MQRSPPPPPPPPVSSPQPRAIRVGTLQGLPTGDDDDLRTRVCELIDGTPIHPAALHRLLCGAHVHRLVITADGEVLGAGKTIRLANRGQRRALRFRHARHCAFPGCEAPIDWCEAHHVTDYDPDPTTDPLHTLARQRIKALAASR